MLPFPYTHSWSRLQKALIIATTVVAFAGVVVASYRHHRSHRLPHESILFGTWQMTAPHDSYILGLYDAVGLIDANANPRWHSGLWIRYDAGERMEGYSEMGWYAGGSNIYMRIVDERLSQIWQIVEIRPDELRLRHAKRDYVFRRVGD